MVNCVHFLCVSAHVKIPWMKGVEWKSLTIPILDRSSQEVHSKGLSYHAHLHYTNSNSQAYEEGGERADRGGNEGEGGQNIIEQGEKQPLTPAFHVLRAPSTVWCGGVQ